MLSSTFQEWEFYHGVCTDQDPECPLNLTNQGAVRTDTGAVLVDSLGFGGHNAALILKRWGK